MKKWRIYLLCVVLCALVVACGKSQPPAVPAPEAAPAEKVEAPAPAPAPVAVEAPAPVVAQPAAPAAAETPEKAAEAAAGEQAVEGGAPKLVVPEPVFEFGTKNDSDTVKHDFLLRNEGTGTLKIENVRASCGCTTTELPKNSLAPGEEVAISAAVNLRGRQGKQTKTVTVFTNDPEQPSFQLRLEGEVLASIMVDPPNVNFGTVMDDEPREAVVTIKATLEELTFKIVGVEVGDMDFIQHEIKEVQEGKTFELVIKTAGALPVGQHNGRMIIRTDSRDRAVIWVPISMQVVGPLQIMPPVINIRFSETPGEVEQQQLRITSGRVESFAIEEVVVPVETMKATLTPAGENTYTLRLDNMPRNDDLEGKSIILKTNLAEHPEIEIPFNIYKPRIRPAEQPPAISPEMKARLKEKIAPPAGVADVADTPAQIKEGE